MDRRYRAKAGCGRFCDTSVLARVGTEFSGKPQMKRD
jgi:hypothetical protein